MESNKLLKNTKFLSEVDRIFKKNRESIIDIILFGSSVKGKESPKDIDLLVLFNVKKDLDLCYELRKNLEKIGLNPEIVAKSYKELFETSFKAREAILTEGFSLIEKKFISEGLGYFNAILFRYELKGFNKSDRMRFYYSLYGRGENEGMLKELKSNKFSDSILLCPVDNENRMKEYLESWKIKYIEIPVLMPERIKNLF
jgi:predicted nucleotidyltransferase